MMLGETEFRHQVESSIRPFRDVLLGLFFVGIGMLIEPAVLPRIWHWALLGALLLLLSKILVVVLIVRRSGMESVAAWQTALLLAVGGEFGFALLAIALDASVLDPQAGQIVLNAVLFSLIGGVLLIRYNQAIASRLARPSGELPPLTEQLAGLPAPRVLIGGYGRVGHTIAVLLKSSGSISSPSIPIRNGLQQGGATAMPFSTATLPTPSCSPPRGPSRPAWPSSRSTAMPWPCGRSPRCASIVRSFR
jgi:CPA2 family monovalent cation:H+ antiporter-2